MFHRVKSGRIQRCRPCVPKPDCMAYFPTVSNGGSRLIITSLRAGFLPLLLIITIIPISICGTRMRLCKAITGRSSIAVLPFGLPENGTGATSVIWTPIIKEVRGTGQTENNYYQQEYYLSASALWRALDNLSFSLATDGSVNRMNADLRDFAKPMRYSWLTALAGKYVTDWMTLSASVLATWVHEDVERGSSAGMHRKLSPYIGVSFKPFAAEEFHVRFFYKDIFRLPSFNDLYYGQTGNINLKPENARQLNVGITYTKQICDFIPYLTLTADAYVNRVRVEHGQFGKGRHQGRRCDGKPRHPSA